MLCRVPDGEEKNFSVSSQCAPGVFSGAFPGKTSPGQATSPREGRSF